MTDAPLQILNFEAKPVRMHIDEAGSVWWSALDVCRNIGIRNSRDAVARLREKHRKTVGNTDTGKSLGFPGQPSGLTFVNEPGLYALIITSRKPQAERFQDWVYEDVLPSIRKTGSYSLRDTQWHSARVEGKHQRRVETDAIQEFIAYATAQGSKSARMYYVNFSRMVNSALVELGAESKPENLRDRMTSFQLHAVSVAETVIARTLTECMTRDLPYSEIYGIAKEKIAVYSSVVGKTPLKLVAPLPLETL